MITAKSRKGKSSGAASKTGVSPEKMREAFRKWLDQNNLNANEAAKKAKISVSAIYNFLNGDTKSLSSTVLQKLALANNSSVDSIISGRADLVAPKKKIKISYRVGAKGSMFVCDDEIYTSSPEGIAMPDDVSAAVVDGDGLAPIPDGWTIFFRNKPTDPDKLIGKLATVRFSGGGERPVVRTILASEHPGLHSLRAMDGSLTEDVKVMTAHEIVSFALTELSRT